MRDTAASLTDELVVGERLIDRGAQRAWDIPSGICGASRDVHVMSRAHRYAPGADGRKSEMRLGEAGPSLRRLSDRHVSEPDSGM